MEYLLNFVASSDNFISTMEILFVFLIVGIIILIGFLGGLFFERTRVQDVLVLLGKGGGGIPG